MSKEKRFEITSASLHIMAMAFMLCDHLWGTIVPGNDWLTCIGRLTFPIYAFMIVEGYFRTKNLKKYIYFIKAHIIMLTTFWVVTQKRMVHGLEFGLQQQKRLV